MIPPIGQVVCRKHIRHFDDIKTGQTIQTYTMSSDWVAQVRIGDDQCVLVWGASGKKYERFSLNDLWTEEMPEEINALSV